MKRLRRKPQSFPCPKCGAYLQHDGFSAYCPSCGWDAISPARLTADEVEAITEEDC